MTLGYLEDQPTRAEVDAIPGIVALEFGANWCGYCRAARPKIDKALASAGELTHIQAADGKGIPLGRSFGIKLWPTVVVLKDGVEVARTIRPGSAADVTAALQQASTEGSNE